MKPAELAAHISLELRTTDQPKLTYDDWTTIKAALRALSAPAPQQSLPVEKINAAPQAGESQSFPQGCSVSDPRTDSNDKSRPVVAAPEQQELIAWHLERADHHEELAKIHKSIPPLAQHHDDNAAKHLATVNALSRSHEDGRRAGLPSEHWLSEAAFHLDLQKEIACVTPYSTVGQMIRHIVEKAHELRLLKTPKGGA